MIMQQNSMMCAALPFPMDVFTSKTYQRITKYNENNISILFYAENRFNQNSKCIYFGHNALHNFKCSRVLIEIGPNELNDETKRKNEFHINKR